VDVDWPLLQEASIAARKKEVMVFPKMFILPLLLIFIKKCLTLRVCSKDVLSEWGRG
jgi:hypothetical protein